MTMAGDNLLDVARGLAGSGEYRQALNCYHDLCRVEPYNPDLWLELAGVAEVAGFVDEAVMTLFHVADLFARAGMAEAADVAERVLMLDPTHAGAQQFVAMFKARRLVSTMPPDPSALAGSAVRTTRISAPLTYPGTASDPYLDSLAIPLPADDVQSGPIPVVKPGGRIVVSDTQVPAEVPVTVAPAGELVGARPLVESLVAATSSPLLDALSADTVSALIDAAQLMRCRKGDIIFRQGDAGSSLYLVLKGSIDVERGDASGRIRKLAALGEGSFFGEMAVLAGMPRSATMRAGTDALLLKLSRKQIRALSTRDSRVIQVLMRFFRARLVGTLLATSPLFTGLSVAERRSLVSRFRMRELPEGTVVIEQGHHADGLYLVLVGQLGAFVTAPGNAGADLGRLGPGDVFGEMSFINGEPAMASIRTVVRSWVLRLPRQDLEQVIQGHPEILELLNQIADGRRAKNRRTMDPGYRKM